MWILKTACTGVWGKAPTFEAEHTVTEPSSSWDVLYFKILLIWLIMQCIHLVLIGQAHLNSSQFSPQLFRYSLLAAWARAEALYVLCYRWFEDSRRMAISRRLVFKFRSFQGEGHRGHRTLLVGSVILARGCQRLLLCFFQHVHAGNSFLIHEDVWKPPESGKMHQLNSRTHTEENEMITTDSIGNYAHSKNLANKM